MTTNDTKRILEAACREGHGDALLDLDPELAERLDALVDAHRRLGPAMQPRLDDGRHTLVRA